ncbi:DNA polymerase [Sulfitobacter phage vB_SupP_AX]|nr:DNA polymerase [Sulfitobacter phage vB_SupP_AX]
MIEISYDNVINCLNKGLHSTSITPTNQVNDWLFQRAVDLWYIEGFSQVKRAERSIEYGPGADKLSIRFKAMDNMIHSNWRGFRGVYLLHPDLNRGNFPLNGQQHEFLDELHAHNERYLEQWRA